MMRATYYDAARNVTIETELESPHEVERLVTEVRQHQSLRGTPTIEISRSDSSSLAFSFDDERAFLVWTDSLGETSHSVGGSFERDLVFDYFGSWSEAPGEHLVPYSDALAAVLEFLRTGIPVTESVLFSPD